MTKAILHKRGQTPIEVYVHGENGNFIDTGGKVKPMVRVSKQYPSRYTFSVRSTELYEFTKRG